MLNIFYPHILICFIGIVYLPIKRHKSINLILCQQGLFIKFKLTAIQKIYMSILLKVLTILLYSIYL
jgi:hypothetical protein